jgi:chemotaxis protein histidine kinase CheA
LKPDPKRQLGSAAEEAEMNQIECSTRDTEQTACGNAVNLPPCPLPAPYSPADNVANIWRTWTVAEAAAADGGIAPAEGAAIAESEASTSASAAAGARAAAEAAAAAVAAVVKVEAEDLEASNNPVGAATAEAEAATSMLEAKIEGHGTLRCCWQACCKAAALPVEMVGDMLKL